MNLSSMWKLNDKHASTAWNVSGLAIDLSVPLDSLDRGATMSLGESSVALFAMEQPAGEGQCQEDVYVRGDDLIMTFRGNNDPFEREIYWRMRESADEAKEDTLQSLEVIFSLKTDLLETWPDPLFNVATNVDSVKYFAASGDLTDDTRTWADASDATTSQLMLLTLNGDCRLAVGVYPSDHESLRMESAAQETKIQFDLQTEFLEKGVIRRTRLFACPGPRGTSDAALLEQANAFLNSEIPLTT